MAQSARPPSPEIVVKEWVRPGDVLWLGAGVAMVVAVVWVLTSVPAGDLVEVGNDSAYPKYVDTHRSPLLILPIVVLAIVVVKFSSQLASPLAARLDQDGINLFACEEGGCRDLAVRSAGRIRRRAPMIACTTCRAAPGVGVGW